jgi:hypothetical protein
MNYQLRQAPTRGGRARFLRLFEYAFCDLLNPRKTKAAYSGFPFGASFSLLASRAHIPISDLHMDYDTESHRSPIGICALAGTQEHIPQSSCIVSENQIKFLQEHLTHMKFQFIPNAAGITDYAVFPNISNKLATFERAPVRLQRGDAKFGFRHIEISHGKELLKLNMTAVQFVSRLIKQGSPIYCEFEGMRQHQKTQVVNLRIGTAVLAYKRLKDDHFYSVITAFSRRQPIGELIGYLE